MIELMPNAVVLVDRILRALEESSHDGEINPHAFFNHDALSNWLPEAKALMQKIEGKHAA